MSPKELKERRSSQAETQRGRCRMGLGAGGKVGQPPRGSHGKPLQGLKPWGLLIRLREVQTCLSHTSWRKTRSDSTAPPAVPPLSLPCLPGRAECVQPGLPGSREVSRAPWLPLQMVPPPLTPCSVPKGCTHAFPHWLAPCGL